MTGEVTLTGLVLPIGGVILPRGNQKDLLDLPKEVQLEMQFVFAEMLPRVVQSRPIAPAKAAQARPTKPSCCCRGALLDTRGDGGRSSEFCGLNPHLSQFAGGCGVRAHACRVETVLDTRWPQTGCVGKSADAARKSACATLLSDVA